MPQQCPARACLGHRNEYKGFTAQGCMVKFDPHGHQPRYESWKEETLAQGIPGLNKLHSQLLIRHIVDMETGQNVARGTKKGARSYIRLNTLRTRLRQIIMHLEQRGLKDIRQLTPEQIHLYFNDLSKGEITRVNGKPYSSIRDMVKDFKSFWHWLIRVLKKEGIDLADITTDLDSSEKENSFVYFIKEELEKMMPYFSPDEQTRMLFMFDTVIRSPTELMNVKVSDISSDFSSLTIREETAKTYGRTIKLLLCKDAVKEYLERNKLKDDDFLFQFSAPLFNKKLKQVAKQLFGNKMTKGGKRYSDMTMYDFRHSGACHWRLGAYRSKIDALMYRGGWSNLEMLNYYTKKLGMKDSIEASDLLVDIDKNKYEQEIVDLKLKMRLLAKYNEDGMKAMYQMLTEFIDKKSNKRGSPELTEAINKWNTSLKEIEVAVTGGEKDGTNGN